MSWKKRKSISRGLVKRIVKLKREKHHRLLFNAHKKHNVSYRTLFYMKEYSDESHTIHTIIKESIKILILASLISSLGGFGLYAIEGRIMVLVPLLILLPALNNMIGDFGTIVSSKFTKLLYLNKVGRKWWRYPEMHALIRTIFIIAFLSSLFVGMLSSAIAFLKGYALTEMIFIKVLAISVVSTMLLVSIIFALSVAAGFYIFKKHEDPNNFLVPLSTSVADLGSMLLFSLMVVLMF